MFVSFHIVWEVISAIWAKIAGILSESIFIRINGIDN